MYFLYYLAFYFMMDLRS